MKRASAIAALLFVASSACAKKDRVINPEAPLWKHRASWSIDVVFREQLRGDAGYGSTTGFEKSIPGIDPRHGRVFVGTSDHGLYALRAGDGSLLWRFQTAGAVNSEPTYDEDLDTVYFGSDDGGLYAVRAKDGALRWRYDAHVEVQRRAVLDTGATGRRIVTFCDAADDVFAADAETGAPIWEHRRQPALGLEISGHAGVTTARGRVYVGFSSGRVAAYDLDDGREKWPEVDLTASVGATPEGEEQKYFDVDTTPLVRGDRVYVAQIETGVYALDALSGQIVWRRAEATGVSWITSWHEAKHKDETTGAEVPEKNFLIAGSGTTGLWALDPATGEMKWRKKAPRGALSYPVSIAHALLVTSSKLGLFLFDAATGEVIDGIDPGSGFAAGAAGFGNRAYVITNSGVFLGLDVQPPEKVTMKHSW